MVSVPIHVGGDIGHLTGGGESCKPLHVLPTVEVLETGGTSQLTRCLARRRLDSMSAVNDYWAPPAQRRGRLGSKVYGDKGEMDAEDRLLRPDLRLAGSDAEIRKVTETARWVADWVGGIRRRFAHGVSDSVR